MKLLAPKTLILVCFFLLSCSSDETDTETVGPIEEAGSLAGFAAAHNAVRSRTQPSIPPLSWDNEVAGVAQSYAEKLASGNCELVHSQGPYGENLYAAWGRDATAEDVVASWAAEEANYDYDSNSCGAVCGHYTQVVWANTSKVGCGMAKCNDGGKIWVCNYEPPGNYIGQAPY